MKDFTVTLTITVPITARNQAQAEERGEQLQEAILLDPKFKAPWFDSIDIPEVTVEES